MSPTESAQATLPRRRSAARARGAGGRGTWDAGRKIGAWLADETLNPERLTCADLARRIGVAYMTISFWVRRGTTPSYRNLLAVARVMGVDLEWLADDVRSYPPDRADSADAVWVSIPEEERAALREVLIDAAERAALIAAARARRASARRA
jgi:transcriptional regulator with XRE-family HTH domain